jgi:hypothetical protein
VLSGSEDDADIYRRAEVFNRMRDNGSVFMFDGTKEGSGSSVSFSVQSGL